MLFSDEYMTDLKRNCLTVIAGAICYFLLYGYLVDNSSNSWTLLLKNWFGYFILFDVVMMGVIYRNYYGRSIINEIVEQEPTEKWDYDPDNHLYIRKDLKDKEHLYDSKIIMVDQTLQSLANHSHIINKTEQELEKVKADVNELDMAIRYAPGGELAKEAEADFNHHLTQLN
jgi:hypothetical protein